MKTKTRTRLSIKVGDPLLDTAEFLLSRIETQNFERCPNRYGFLLTLAAFMEARLNEAIIDWGNIIAPHDDGPTHANSFLTMSFRSKLNAIFFIITEGVYVTNTSCREYLDLSKLIGIRNELAHMKPYVLDQEIEYEHLEEGGRRFQLPGEAIAKAYGAIGKLEKSDLDRLLSSVKELDHALNVEGNPDQSPLCKKIEQVAGPKPPTAAESA